MNYKATKTVEKQINQSHLILLFIIIAFFAVIRFRLIDVPLERDEGEYAYAGQLILNGMPPYTLAYNMKLPGIYAIYALILTIFGQTHSGIHVGLLIINMATIIILFLLTNKLFGLVAGLTAAAAFALLSICISVQGIFANAEHFVILFACSGLLVMIQAKERNKLWMLFVGGILLGLGLLIKQHGSFLVMFGGIYLFCSEIKYKISLKKTIFKCILYLFSASIPFIAMCVILTWAGIFEKFWFWTFQYAKQYVSSVPLAIGIDNLVKMIGPITSTSRLIWLSSLIGLLSLIFSNRNKEYRGFALGFMLFSFISVCPAFYFRRHYFILLLPAVAMHAGIAADSLFGYFNKNHYRMLTRITPFIIVAFVLGESIYNQRNFFFKQTPNEIAHRVYGKNPFVESLEVARYINKNSKADDRVAVIGSEPQIYFYSNRRSATGYIYTYALMENHPYAVKMQQEMISEIESIGPEFIVLVGVESSWLYRPNSSTIIFEWINDYTKNYNCTGLIEIFSEQTIYAWDDQAKNCTTDSTAWLKIYRRKKDQ